MPYYSSFQDIQTTCLYRELLFDIMKNPLFLIAKKIFDTDFYPVSEIDFAKKIRATIRNYILNLGPTINNRHSESQQVLAMAQIIKSNTHLGNFITHNFFQYLNSDLLGGKSEKNEKKTLPFKIFKNLDRNVVEEDY